MRVIDPESRAGFLFLGIRPMNWTERQLKRVLRREGYLSLAPNTADTSAPPFLLLEEVALDLPPPLSVNRLRKIDWSAEVRNEAWKRGADAYVFMAKRDPKNPLKLARIPCFEVSLVFDESQTGIDLDNGVKGILDYLCFIGLIEDDGPQHMRRLTVEWGNAPSGARVTIRPLASVSGANS